MSAPNDDTAHDILRRFHSAVDEAIRVAEDEGYTGKLWAWIARRGPWTELVHGASVLEIRIARTPPRWPVEDAVTAIYEFEVQTLH